MPIVCGCLKGPRTSVFRIYANGSLYVTLELPEAHKRLIELICVMKASSIVRQS